MAQKAKELATTYNLDIQILEKKELEKLNMEGILAVGQGSINEPHLIILEHNKDRKDLDTNVIIQVLMYFSHTCYQQLPLLVSKERNLIG